MPPVPSVGVISFTKFTGPERVVEVLAGVDPGATTAAEVKAALESGGQAGPLWDDLLTYDPVATTAGPQVAADNELLRAARDKRDDALLLLWVALNLTDARLDALVREVLTDEDGHLSASAVNSSNLRHQLDLRNAQSSVPLPTGDKTASNILSLLERCQLVAPAKHGGSIVGIDHPLPTRHAVPAAVALTAERLAVYGVAAVPGHDVDLALAVGVNAWLNLSPDEFRRAYANPDEVATQPQSSRDSVPGDLAEVAAQLRRTGQVVLQGPPGAGKTYVARKYVRWATGGRPEDSRLQAVIDALPENERHVESIADEVQRRGLVALWDIVQFHPGYEYTDFVRALVARPHGAGVTFVPEHRILSLICAVGVALAERNYNVETVLILDEINRGDIPNIFGELLYALEYRGQAVATPYTVSGDASLVIPSGLHVLGTMNTADRSIAVIDYALRRRFVFLDVPASDQPIKAFDYDSEDTRAAALFLYDATSSALSNASSGLQVGPSYYLTTADGSDSSAAVLAGRYVYEVLPLLTEYELEGDVDPGVVGSLREKLGLDDAKSQQANVAALTGYLTTLPWLPVGPPAAVDHPRNSGQDDTAVP